MFLWEDRYWKLLFGHLADIALLDSIYFLPLHVHSLFECRKVAFLICRCASDWRILLCCSRIHCVLKIHYCTWNFFQLFCRILFQGILSFLGQIPSTRFPAGISSRAECWEVGSNGGSNVLFTSTPHSSNLRQIFNAWFSVKKNLFHIYSITFSC